MDFWLALTTGEQSWLLKRLFWVTETVTQPWGVITFDFIRLVSLVSAFRIKAAIMLFAILAAAILMGQGVKSGSKTKSGNHDLLLSGWKKTHHIPVDEFYTLKRAERGNLVKEQLAEEKYPTIFAFTLAERETGFAFPSGHTMFAASWALLAVGFAVAASANVNHCYLVGLGRESWEAACCSGCIGRDLVVATLISWALVAVATWLAQRIVGH